MKIVMLCFLAVITRGILAATAYVDGLNWTYTVANGVASLGGGSSTSTAVPTSTTGAITIPESLGGYPVKSVGDSAFSQCYSLTSVTIPNGVTNISSAAFYNCRSLTSITIPDSVTSVGYYAFNGCNSSLFNTTKIPRVKLVDGWAVGSDGTLYTLDLSGVRGIGSSAFLNCDQLTRVTMPDSIKSIPQSAFNGCSSLSSLTIPNSVTSIGSNAFSGCGLRSVTIPDSVTSIGSYAFYRCTSLTSVTIPNGVISVGEGAFERCVALTNVTIPNSVESIGEVAFRDCSKLTNVAIGQLVCSSRLSETFPSSFRAITDVVIVDGVTNIAQQTFSDCSNLKSIVIGREVESIASDAFRNCSALVSVTIPQVVCNSKLSSVFPSSYQSITNVVICDGVANIGEGAFDACGSLKNVEIPNSITNIGRYAFRDCSSLQGARIPNSVTDIGDWAFYNCNALTDVTIPDTVARIGTRAFSNCGNITQIVIPDSVTSVGTCAFANCSGLVKAEIGCGSIGYQAFVDCSMLTDVTFGNHVTKIGNSAFFGCSGLMSITIPSSVEEIEAAAFGGNNVKADIVVPLDIGKIKLGRYASGADAKIIQPCKTGLDFVWIDDLGNDVESPFRSETDVTVTPYWRVKSVVVNPAGGVEFENTSETVALSCSTADATILYTTDGSNPSENGVVYKRPFNIYKSCIVRAVAIMDGCRNSLEATATFTRAESLSEAANLFGYTMESDANAPWVVDSDMSRDGVSSVRSGTIGNNGATTLSVSLRKSGTVSFWWCAKCEEAEVEDGETYYYDYGSFSVDGNVVARIAGNDTDWQHVSHEITTGGKHVLSWEYRKDGVTSYAPDCIWVDQVQWIPADGSGYTLTTPEPVPYAWLDQYNLGIGTDYETAGNAASGKMNWGKPSAVWEEYVAGLDPTDANSRLVANIEMRDGVPFVSWTPDLNTNGIIRTYKVYGSETLEKGGNWQYPTNSLHRFFRVKVEMP